MKKINNAKQCHMLMSNQYSKTIEREVYFTEI